METQQLLLIKALKAVSRHVPQAVGEGGLKEILETVRSCGFDFDGLGDQANIAEPAIKMLQAKWLNDDHTDEAENVSSTRKRKREAGIFPMDGIPTSMAGYSGNLELTSLDAGDSFTHKEASK